MSDTTDMAKVTITVERPDGVTIGIEKKHEDEWVALASGMRALLDLHRYDGGLENLVDEVVRGTTSRFEHNATEASRGGRRG